MQLEKRNGFWTSILRMFWYSFFLIVATGPITSAGGSHSFHAFLTAVTGTSEIPEFVALSYVDDVLIGRYDSTNQTLEPRAKWVVDAVGEDHWNRYVMILKEEQLKSKNYLKIVMALDNQTSGIHSWQLMCGCSVNDGITSGFFQYGYDGQDYITFDEETQTWTAGAPTAEKLKEEWDSDKLFFVKWKVRFENECTELLQEYLKNPHSSLGRKVPPEAKMIDKTDGGSTKLKCAVSGFYPQDIDVYFVKGDNERIETATSSGVVPNSDGTYYTEKWIETDPQDKYHHSCHIEHESLEPKLIVKLDQTSSVALIVGIVIAVVAVILIAVIAVVICKKKKKVVKEYTSANISENRI